MAADLGSGGKGHLRRNAHFVHAGLIPSVARVRVASRAWWRLAAAMLAWPSSRRMLMARLRSVAITRGAFPVLTRDLSS